MPQGTLSLVNIIWYIQSVRQSVSQTDRHSVSQSVSQSVIQSLSLDNSAKHAGIIYTLQNGTYKNINAMNSTYFRSSGYLYLHFTKNTTWVGLNFVRFLYLFPYLNLFYETVDNVGHRACFLFTLQMRMNVQQLQYHEWRKLQMYPRNWDM